MASLSNYLVLLKLPEQLRIPFTKFAVKTNLQIGNVQSASKLDPTVNKDRSSSRNLTAYEDFCSQCSEALPFGLASPLCKECKSRVKVCYGCLTVQKTLKVC